MAEETRPMARASEVAEHLGVSRATFYRIAFFKQRAVYVRSRSPRWDWSDIELYKALRAQERAA